MDEVDGGREGTVEEVLTRNIARRFQGDPNMSTCNYLKSFESLAKEKSSTDDKTRA